MMETLEGSTVEEHKEVSIRTPKKVNSSGEKNDHRFKCKRDGERWIHPITQTP